VIKGFKEFIKRDLIDRVAYYNRLKKNTPVMVYQMGKVASSSIYHPLKKVYPGVVVHSHQFNQDAWYWEVRNLHKRYYKEEIPKFKIISLIREPIGRNISEFFHRFKQFGGIESEASDFSIDEILNLFNSKLDHDFPLNWFDKNFKKHFGLDVYQFPFPKNNGYTHYSAEKADVLLMYHNLEDSQKTDLINQFLSIDNFSVEVRNVGEKKSYSGTYSQFKKEAKLSKTYLDKMKNSKYFTHFYTPEYIESIIAKWQS